MRKHVCRHLREHGLLYNAQHGFLKGRLGLLKLLNLLSEVIDKLDERKLKCVTSTPSRLSTRSTSDR